MGLKNYDLIYDFLSLTFLNFWQLDQKDFANVSIFDVPLSVEPPPVPSESGLQLYPTASSTYDIFTLSSHYLYPRNLLAPLFLADGMPDVDTSIESNQSILLEPTPNHARLIALHFQQYKRHYCNSSFKVLFMGISTTHHNHT